MMFLLAMTSAHALTWNPNPGVGTPPNGYFDVDNGLLGDQILTWWPDASAEHPLGYFRGTTTELANLDKGWVDDNYPYQAGHAGVRVVFGATTCLMVPCNLNSYRTMKMVVDTSEFVGGGDDEWGMACIPIDPAESIPETSDAYFNCTNPWVEFHIITF